MKSSFIKYIFIVSIFFSCNPQFPKSTYPKEIQEQKLENLYDSARWRFYIYHFNAQECVCKDKSDKLFKYNIPIVSMNVQLLDIYSQLDTIRIKLAFKSNDTTLCWPHSEYNFSTFVGIKSKQIIEYMILDGARFNNGLYIDQIFNDSANNSETVKFLYTKNLFPLRKQEVYFLNYVKNTDIPINEWLRKEIDKKTHHK